MANSTTDLEWPINWDVEWLCNADEDCARWVDAGEVAKCGNLLDHGIPIARDEPEK